MSIKNYFTKKQNTYLKVLQLRYCGRDSIIQVRNRPYFHYGPFGRTKNKMEVVQTYKTSCRYVTYSRFGQLCLIIKEDPGLNVPDLALLSGSLLNTCH